MIKKQLTCEEAQIRMMGLIDSELSEDQEKELLEHIKICPSCRKKYDAFVGLKNEAKAMKLKKIPDMYWDDYWNQVYNRMERGIGWILFSIGLILLLIYGSYEVLYDFFMNPAKPLLLKIGAGIFTGGVVVLFVSVFREKLMVRKVDQYRSVKR